ncbi:MAG TPA: NAD(P)-binding domain-containing protein [Acetobacteraceae bacterium]|nr:NAD(P)-binding domain-containing protein [Acetobacteraceae bacterium]
MQIAIVGAGNVGKALATGWIAAGHQVTFGVRDPQSPPQEGPSGAGYASVADAAKAAAVVVLATPWPAVPDALAVAGDLGGKVLIDCTNPLRVDAAGIALDVGFTTSGGEQVATLAKGASVFKTLNQTGFDNMQHANGYTSLPAAMFVAGDDEAKKPVVLSLVSDLGFQAIDAGPLAIARLLEPMAMLWIHMALRRGMPPSRAFAMTDRV